LDYALDESILGPDSILVRFAPAEITISGVCSGGDTIPVVFSSHDGMITGSGTLTYQDELQ